MFLVVEMFSNCKRISSKVIYKYKGNISNDVCIGETKRQPLFHQQEHLEKLVFRDKLLKYNEKDARAISKHYHHHQHVADLLKLTILGKAINNYHLKLKESLLILKSKPSLNIAKESMPLFLSDKGSQKDVGIYAIWF